MSSGAPGIATHIDDLLKSDRFFRIVSVSAQVYSLQDNSSEWRELSPCPILVHLYNDGVENLAKLLALHNMELIISHCPLLPHFTVHCPSKKFLHVMSNKFDPQSPVYGFGFSNAFDLETLFLHLRRLKATAMGGGASVPSPRRSLSSRPTTPALGSSFQPFSPGPRFAPPAAVYKDYSPYQSRHSPHHLAFSTSSSSSALYDEAARGGSISRRRGLGISRSGEREHPTEETEDLQPYFGYGEGTCSDGGYGGIEGLGGDGGEEDELESEEAAEEKEEANLNHHFDSLIKMRNASRPMRSLRSSLIMRGASFAPLNAGLGMEGVLASSTPLSTPGCLSPSPTIGAAPASLDGDAPNDEAEAEVRLPAESSSRRDSSAYDDVFFSPNKHFSNFVLGCDLRANSPRPTPKAKGVEQSDSSPSLTTLISHFTPLSLDTDPSPFPGGDNPAGVIGSPVKGIGGKHHPYAHAHVQ